MKRQVQAFFSHGLIDNLFKIIVGVLAVVSGYMTYVSTDRANTIRKLEDEISYLNKVNLEISGKVSPENDRKLIGEARRSIQILGINCIAPLHHCREELIRFLKKTGGTLQVMLLDPSGKWFGKRVQFERDNVGRLKSEWLASIKLIREIREKSEGRGNVEVRLYNAEPRCSLLIIDALNADPKEGRMLVNIYPRKEGCRGYEGGQFMVRNALIRDWDCYEKRLSYYSDLWNTARGVGRLEAYGN